MKCVFCLNSTTEVVETRVINSGLAIRRRRKCPKCEKRFTTYERLEVLPILVIKRDGRREKFDEQKVRQGIIKASEKTTVTNEVIDDIVDKVWNKIRQNNSTEIKSVEIGRLIADELKKIDRIAYIRFASVFKRFVDIEDLNNEIKKL
ncbi:MAG: transcriptional repressor NrdR [Patescibacteria group bacterium]|nr:MAG: transcriptional repressor NrdR [Patescibacteria group bacterium]